MPIPNPTKGESQDDFIGRCMGVLKDDFPDQKQRAAVCFGSWRKKRGGDKPRGNMILLQAEAGESRRETFNGKEHVVIPVVALVEGVIHGMNAESPELALASEFGKAPAGWNGRPVTINHPEISGQIVPANSPDVLETEQVGQIFNTVVDGKKLKTEAWINIERAQELGAEDKEIKGAIDKLLAGDIVEVSTGYFSDIEQEDGKFNGKSFSGIQRNIVPDHLAILGSGKIGACSIADGCGANRVNEQCNCRGSFKMAEGAEKEKDDVASNSLSNNDGGDEKSEVRGILDKLKNLMGLKSNKDLSHRTIQNAIEAALSSEGGMAFVVDVFKDHFIVQKDGGLFKRDFKITEGGKVRLGESETQVRFEAGFVEFKMNEEDDMSKEQEFDKDKFIEGLITNEKSDFDEGDKDWLSELEEKQLVKLAPKEGGDPESTPKANKKKEKKEEKKEEVKANESKDAVTLDSYISSAPKEFQPILRQSLRAHEARVNELVEVIKGNSRNRFSDEQLAGFDIDTLENLASLATEDDFSGRGAPRENASKDKKSVPDPVDVFDLSAARKKAS